MSAQAKSLSDRRGEREQVDPQVIEDGGPGRTPRARAPARCENQESAMVGDPAVPCHSPAHVLGQGGEHGGQRRQQRDEVERREEEQRDEDELLGRHVEVAVLEAHARDDRVADDQADDQQPVGVALVVHEHGDRDGDGQEQQRGHACRRRARARPYAACDARAPRRRGARPASRASSSRSGGGQEGARRNAHLCGANLQRKRSLWGRPARSADRASCNGLRA